MNPTLALDPTVMRHRALRGLTALTLALAATGVAAQTAAPAAKAKPVPAKTAAAKPAAKPAAKKGPPPPPPLPAAAGEQMAAASMAHYGTYNCEFSQTVEVGLNASNEGYLDVKFGKQAWIMKPVLSSTGALRLEDVKGRILMLQNANKSMLMDTQAGRRMVDECLHEKQADFVKTAAATAAAEAASAATAAAAATAATAAAAATAASAATAITPAPAGSAPQ